MQKETHQRKTKTEHYYCVNLRLTCSSTFLLANVYARILVVLQSVFDIFADVRREI